MVAPTPQKCGRRDLTIACQQCVNLTDADISQWNLSSIGHINKYMKCVDINDISCMIRLIVDIDDISIIGAKHAKRASAI